MCLRVRPNACDGVLRYHLHISVTSEVRHSLFSAKTVTTFAGVVDYTKYLQRCAMLQLSIFKPGPQDRASPPRL